MTFPTPQIVTVTAFVAWVISAGGVAYAADWETSAGVAPAVTYTDNVCLTNSDEQSEWIALVTPDILLRGEGARANGFLDAEVEINSLTDSKLESLGCIPRGVRSRGQYSPKMDAGFDAELYKNWLYIDATANISQNSVSPFLAGGGDSLDRTGNTNTSYRYNVSPSVYHRFKDVAILDLRYTYNEQINSKDVVGESEQNRLGFSVSSVPGTSSFLWGVEAKHDEVQYDSTRSTRSRDSTLKSAQVNLGYQFDNTWQVNGYVGEENNDFFSTADEIDGSFWDVGIRWTPNSRITFDVGGGDRFFGATPRFDLNYRHKRSLLSAGYKKDLTYDRNIRTLSDPVTGLPQDSTTISDSPILDERFTLSYQYDAIRSTIKVSTSISDQTRAVDARDSRFSTFTLFVDRRLARNFSVDGSVSWSETDPRGERSDLVVYSEAWRANVGVTHEMNQGLDMTLRYLFVDRESERLSGQYTENRLTLSFRFEL